MTWRKKIGCRGPLSDAASDAARRTALTESGTAVFCCAPEGVPTMKSAAAAAAATAPTIRPGFRIRVIVSREDQPGMCEVIFTNCDWLRPPFGQRAPKYSGGHTFHNADQYLFRLG